MTVSRRFSAIYKLSIDLTAFLRYDTDSDMKPHFCDHSKQEAIILRNYRKPAALLLALCILVSLAACSSGSEYEIYRVIDTVAKDQYAVAFREGDKLCEQVTAALQHLASNGTLASISGKWFNQNKVILEPDSAPFEALSAQLEEGESFPAREFIIGVNPYATNMSLRGPDGSYSGFDIDVANAVCELYGWQLRVIPIHADDIFVELNSGNVDAAWGGFSPAEDGKLSYSPAYMDYEHILVSRMDSGVKRLGQVDNKTLGAVSAAAAENILLHNKDTAKFTVTYRELDGVEACFRALDSGAVGVILVDSITAREHLR